MFLRGLGVLRCLALGFLPWGVLFWTLFGFAYIPTVVAGVGALITLGVVALRSERILLRAHRRAEPIPGIEVSWFRALHERDLQVDSSPEILVFPDPAPNAIVFRGPWSDGVLLLSQGLIDRLSESELRSVLALSSQYLMQKGLARRTFAAACASLLLSLAPRGWRDQLTQSRAGAPLGTMGLTAPEFALFSFILGYAGGFVRSFSRAEVTVEDSPVAAEAVRKIRRAAMGWGLAWAPGAARLYLFAPLPGPTSDLMALSWA